MRVPRSSELDLRDPAAARAAVEGAQVVLHLAARVGGIGFHKANPAVMAHDNLLMTVNVFEQSRAAGVRKLVVAGTASSYPRRAPRPFREDDLWDGCPDASEAPYGLAKRMAQVLSEAYRAQHGFDSAVPILTNLYGPEDHTDLETAHVLAAMVRKYVDATARGDARVTLWGTGTPTREFLHVDDAARAMLLAAERLDTSAPVNVGTGVETPLRDLAATIERLTGFAGETVWDTSRPDGQPTRRLDVARARELLGFEARVALEDGLRETIAAYRAGHVRRPSKPAGRPGPRGRGSP